MFQCCRNPDVWINLQGMKDFELYQQILGLVGPWRVESVTLKTQQQEIEVRVGVTDTLWGTI